MKALILVDIQPDFMPGGSLAVEGGHEVVPVANRLAEHCELVFATQDWHPPDHTSFAGNNPGHEIGEVVEHKGLEQIMWPDHCIQNTPGAELHEDLDRDAITRVYRKGMDRDLDSYSGFYDNGHRNATGLGDELKRRGVDEVYILGLATDVCVKFTALDAARLQFRTFVVIDGCRGVELNEGDIEKAIAEMRDAGAEMIRSDEALERLRS